MIEFSISIAGIAVGIRAMYDSTREYCAGYLTDDQPEIIVESTYEIIQREQERSNRQAIEEGNTPEQLKESDLEKMGIYREIAEQFLDRDILLFHGSAVGIDGEVYLFTAKSGIGKSTHTRRWRLLLKKRAVMVNDDKPMLKITPEGCLVCGTPWNGKHRLGSNVILPLKAICVLERAEKNTIHSLELWDALPILIHQCYHPMDSSRIPKVMELLYSVMEHALLYKMDCNNMESDAAQVSFERMSKDRKERKDQYAENQRRIYFEKNG